MRTEQAKAHAAMRFRLPVYRLPLNIISMPVSYTHLDVYKRQPPNRPTAVW